MLSGLKSWSVSPLRRPTSFRQSPVHAAVMQINPVSTAATPSGSRNTAPTSGNPKSHTSRRNQSRGKSLTQVPGVGPKYEALLRGKGLTSVPDLVHLYQTHGEEAGRYLQVIPYGCQSIVPFQRHNLFKSLVFHPMHLLRIAPCATPPHCPIRRSHWNGSH